MRYIAAVNLARDPGAGCVRGTGARLETSGAGIGSQAPHNKGGH